MNAQSHIPEGYWIDPKGNLVPEANVKDIDKLRDETVRRIWALAEELHQEMKKFKQSAWAGAVVVLLWCGMIISLLWMATK